MFTNNTSHRLGRFEYGIVKRKVRQLIGRVGFTAQDREDLEQELLARLLKSLESFDPRKAHRNVFVTAVVERDVANILRDRQADKRNHHHMSSINVTIDVCERGATELADTISQREQDARHCRSPRRPQELVELRVDLRDFLVKSTAADRELAAALMSKTIAEIAREWGIPRTTLSDRVRKLRKRWERSGLRIYL